MPHETLHMKQSDKKGNKNKIGSYGEHIAARQVSRMGWKILDINYLKKWGEIDIVARETSNNKEIVHFIEVKTVSYETKAALESAVARGTWRPEENVHFDKIQRLNRAIESWIMENNYEGEWQIDVAAVRVVPNEKYATIKIILNIVL
jgi:putative endonuclease